MCNASKLKDSEIVTSLDAKMTSNRVERVNFFCVSEKFAFGERFMPYLLFTCNVMLNKHVEAIWEITIYNWKKKNNKKSFERNLQVRPTPTLTHQSASPTEEDYEGRGWKLPSTFQESRQGWDQSSPAFGPQRTPDPWALLWWGSRHPHKRSCRPPPLLKQKNLFVRQSLPNESNCTKYHLHTNLPYSPWHYTVHWPAWAPHAGVQELQLGVVEEPAQPQWPQLQLRCQHIDTGQASWHKKYSLCQSVGKPLELSLACKISQWTNPNPL